MVDPEGQPAEQHLEELIADAVLVLEQRGEPGLQEYLARHATFAGEVRDGLERLRRMGVLAPPPAAVEEPRQYGEFRVLRKLAAGGMGVVYLAEQTSLKRQVALKVVRPELLLSPTARERFQREVETVARLQHPGIVPILAVGAEGPVPWFAMEYIEGRSLEAMIESLRGKDLGRGAEALRSAFDAPATKASGASAVFAGSHWEACVRMLLQVAQTMSYVHARGIVHRDLKPSNVVVTPQGQALVLDFGLAHVQDRQRVTRIDAPVGSPAYMAPEQLRGEAIDERVDVYALGVTLYQLLTGALPFVAEGPERLQALICAGRPRPVRAVNRAVPRDVAIVCAVAMEAERGRRYGSMADFASDLDAVLARRPIRAHAPGLLVRLVRTCQRHPTWTTIAAAALLLALQFPLLLWQWQAAANAELAEANRQLEAAARHQQETNAALARSNAQLREQRELAVSSYHDALVALEEMLVRTGQTDLAATPGSERLRLGILERALGLYDRLRQRRPGERRLEVDAARTLQFAGSLQLTMGANDAAEARFGEVLARLEATPGDEAATVRGVTRKLFGQSLTYRGQHPAAEAMLRLALCELEGVVARDPDDLSSLRQLAEVKNSLALVRRALGDPVADLQLLTEAQHHKERLLLAAPDDLGGVSAYALGCANLASALERQQRLAEAEALLGVGITALQRLRPVGPESSNARARLASLHDKRGSLRQENGRPGPAEADHGVALALRLELATEFPSTAAFVNQAGASLHNLARVRQDVGDFADALQLAEDSVARQRQAVRMAPQQQLYRQHLEYALVSRCLCRLELAQFAALPAAIDELVDGAVSVEGLLNGARLYTRCARGVADAALARDLRQRAVRAIEGAVAKGFGDAAHFETGRWAKHYQDLRGLPAFEALLTALRAKR